MFTGIIIAVGHIRTAIAEGGDLRLEIFSDKLGLEDVVLGDSIAVNGVCLTVVQKTTHSFWADVSRETLACSTLQRVKVGSPVNLEKALLPTRRLGGHWVSGHVDGIGEVLMRQENARAVQFRLKAPESLARYIALKGSITVDGVSLTVNAVAGAEFELTIVPHTLRNTIMTNYQPGWQVNLEVDILARYIERLWLGQTPHNTSASKLNEGFLAEHGYLKS